MAEEGSEADSDRGQVDEAGGSSGLIQAEFRAEPQAEVSLYELVDFLARNLVLHPEDVEVKQNQTDQLSSFEVRVNKDDLGRVIGKQGRTAKSLRTILNAAASRVQQKQVIAFTRDLANLISAGLPLDRAFELLVSPTWRPPDDPRDLGVMLGTVTWVS